MKRDGGITLIALTITIVVTVVIAAAIINLMVNEGIAKIAVNSAEKHEIAKNAEEKVLSEYKNQINGYRSSNTVTISKQDYDDMVKKIKDLEEKTEVSTTQLTDIKERSNINTKCNKEMWKCCTSKCQRIL